VQRACERDVHGSITGQRCIVTAANGAILGMVLSFATV
jgi:hypothetical protein